eukprot:TRINITY_DN23497_c0_g1_i1.p1 TRINITY_DN23497_c0_g1~~TRINITY_DN23497_c0_g1_i1.p1  ORF type:complete len:339 (+),score=53.23 TRINITY_DN23497_c0_g1_i1:151-1167(+)
MSSNLKACIAVAITSAVFLSFQLLIPHAFSDGAPPLDCSSCKTSSLVSDVAVSSGGGHVAAEGAFGRGGGGGGAYLGVQASSDEGAFDFDRIPEDYRAACRKFLTPRSDANMYSQFRQDWFIFNNYFRGRKYGDGFYVDVGANHPRTLSNTLFFDKCLGWRGICVEPNPIYHKGYQHRSCTLAPHCVWKERKALWFDLPGTDSKGTAGRILNCTDDGICSDKGIGRKAKITCLSLDEIMAQYAPESGLPPVIDLLSVDVEGFEIDVLEPTDLSKYNVSVVTVEINKIPQNKLHYIMSQQGFSKDVSVGIDDVFVRRARPLVFPSNWREVGPYSQRYHP